MPEWTAESKQNLKPPYLCDASLSAPLSVTLAAISRMKEINQLFATTAAHAARW